MHHRVLASSHRKVRYLAFLRRKVRYLALSSPLGCPPKNLERIAGANSRRDDHLLLVPQ